MSSITVSSLERITASELAEMLLAADANANTIAAGEQATGAESSIAIVDVRDDDHIGGHIRTSMHFPSVSLDATMPTLLRKLADKEIVVFHCALSQQRGPGAALQYLREKEAAAAAAAADVASQKTGGAVEGEKGNGDGARVVKGTEVKPQKVYVLDRGFVGWQEVYGLDERLTDAYRKELWEQGY